MLTTGGVVFCTAVAVAVETHPFVLEVTVRVYVPGVVTVGFCKLDVKLLGPVQPKVTFGAAGEPPFNWTVAFTQVI